MKPAQSGITKQDVAEADKDSAALDRYGESKEGDGGYMEDLAEALSRRKSDSAGPSRMEKLRMRWLPPRPFPSVSSPARP